MARLERLDEHFHRYVDDGLISGVVTYIVRCGQVVHQDAYGLSSTRKASSSMTDEFETLVYQAIVD